MTEFDWVALYIERVDTNEDTDGGAPPADTRGAGGAGQGKDSSTASAGRCLDEYERLVEVAELSRKWARKRSTALEERRQSGRVSPRFGNPVQLQDQLKKVGVRFVFRCNDELMDNSLKLDPLYDSRLQPELDLTNVQSSNISPDTKCQSGYLEKRGKRNRAWKERWFVLLGTQLYYFKNEFHKKSLGCIDLKYADVTEAPEMRFKKQTRHAATHLLLQSPMSPRLASSDVQKNIEKEVRRSGKRGNANAVGTLHRMKNNPFFSIEDQFAELDSYFYFDITTSKRVFHLRCRTAEDMGIWLSEIRGRGALQEENDEMDALDDVLSGIELAKSNEEGKILERNSTLKGLFQNKASLVHLMRWARKNHCEEYIAFLAEAHMYEQGAIDNALTAILNGNAKHKRTGTTTSGHGSGSLEMTLEGKSTTDIKSLQEHAKSMFERYVRVGGERELPIDAKERGTILRSIQGGDLKRECFKQLQHQIRSHVDSVHLPAFTDSTEFSRLLVESHVPVNFLQQNPVSRYSAAQYRKDLYPVIMSDFEDKDAKRDSDPGARSRAVSVPSSEAGKVGSVDGIGIPKEKENGTQGVSNGNNITPAMKRTQTERPYSSATLRPGQPRSARPSILFTTIGDLGSQQALFAPDGKDNDDDDDDANSDFSDMSDMSMVSPRSPSPRDIPSPVSPISPRRGSKLNENPTLAKLRKMSVRRNSRLPLNQQGGRAGTTSLLTLPAGARAHSSSTTSSPPPPPDDKTVVIPPIPIGRVHKIDTSKAVPKAEEDSEDDDGGSTPLPPPMHDYPLLSESESDDEPPPPPHVPPPLLSDSDEDEEERYGSSPEKRRERGGPPIVVREESNEFLDAGTETEPDTPSTMTAEDDRALDGAISLLRSMSATRVRALSHQRTNSGSNMNSLTSNPLLGLSSNPLSALGGHSGGGDGLESNPLAAAMNVGSKKEITPPPPAPRARRGPSRKAPTRPPTSQASSVLKQRRKSHLHPVTSMKALRAKFLEIEDGGSAGDKGKSNDGSSSSTSLSSSSSTTTPKSTSGRVIRPPPPPSSTSGVPRRARNDSTEMKRRSSDAEATEDEDADSEGEGEHQVMIGRNGRQARFTGSSSVYDRARAISREIHKIEDLLKRDKDIRDTRRLRRIKE